MTILNQDLVTRGTYEVTSVQNIDEPRDLAHLGGGGGILDFAYPIHATIATARITHPNMSYLRSLLFGFPLCSKESQNI